MTPAGRRDAADAALGTWPFWAPSHEASVSAALDLAAVAPGERLLDLGCGDGQVLLAAAARGAHVAGVEADPALAREAAQRLADAGVDADVTVGDLFDPDLTLDADVLFAYLAPATLQRLGPLLSRHAGRRLVTVDFAVPTLVATRRSGPARLYRLPGRRRPVGPTGWSCAGTFVSTVADCQSLSCLEVVHPGGPTGVGLSRPLHAVATAASGADVLDGPGHLAIDLRWEPMPPGTIAGGTVTVRGLDGHALFVLATDDDDEGMWELSPDGVAGLRRALRRRQPPSTLAAALDAAR